MLNVVVLNGGRGAATLIPALLAQEGLRVTSVVNAYDDGKSTGEIRRFFGMLGPSDIRKVQELMLRENDPDYAANLNLFAYRYPLDCDRDTVIADLRAFAEGRRDDVVGSVFSTATVRAALQVFVRDFLDGLAIIEKVVPERFSFADCSIMNCIYAGAFLHFNRNIEQATMFISRLFKLRGTVLPNSIEDKKLTALREDGEMLYCEAEIVELRSNVRIERIYLLDQPPARERFEPLSRAEKRAYLERHHCFVETTPHVQLALQQADVIIYSAGTQHSSLYPTYLTTGLARAIADNRAAFKVFVTNIGADYETPSYVASDYLRGAYRYLNLGDARDYALNELFDRVLINTGRRKGDETYVEFDAAGFADLDVAQDLADFESAEAPGRHDGAKLVATILERFEQASPGLRA
ncbi:MAG TPA: 2-phospho-L-lactate transferase CofD family protein [Novosphingobium sp.]|nr:2-phospho-L-lactate transferase CofD family protein [Novosphingobium sp.]